MREREAVGDNIRKIHAQRAPRLQLSSLLQGGGYRRFTPGSTSLTARGLTVLGMGWRGIKPGAQVGCFLLWVLMRFTPLTRVLLECSYHHQD